MVGKASTVAPHFDFAEFLIAYAIHITYYITYCKCIWQERAQSPLLGALMTSLAHILKDYRTEIDDILASNRQLAAELEFDLRQQETREQEEAAAAESEEVQKRVAGM